MHTEKLRSLYTLVMSITSMTLNATLIGGIISAIWLITLGEWRSILAGIIIALITIPIIPKLITIISSIFMYKETDSIVKIRIMVSIISSIAFFILMICSILILFNFINNSTKSSFIPSIIFSYTIAMAPVLAFNAKIISGKLEEAVVVGVSGITSYMISVAYIISSIFVILYNVTLQYIVCIFVASMLFGLIIQFLIGFLAEKDRLNNMP